MNGNGENGNGKQHVVNFFKAYKSAMSTGKYEAFFRDPYVISMMASLERKMLSDPTFHYQRPERPEMHEVS